MLEIKTVTNGPTPGAKHFQPFRNGLISMMVTAILPDRVFKTGIAAYPGGRLIVGRDPT
jgi:hypothetical protein